MPDNLTTMAGYLRLHTPEIPLGLAYTYVNNAYRALLDFPTDGWSFLFRQAQFITHQSITGTCMATQGSTLVSSVVAGNGIASFTVAAGGTGYAVNDLLYPVGYTGGVLTVATVSGGGAVLTATITNPGANFIQASNVPTSTSGAGVGAKINITGLGNGQLPGDRSAIVGRQVLFAGIPPIASIVDNQNGTSFVMDEAFGGVSGSVQFEITNIYFTPSDSNLERIMCLTDPPNGVQLPTSFTFEDLNNIDAQRSSSGTPYLLADVDMNVAYLSQLPNGVVDSFGQTNTSQPVLRKEFYPRNQSNYQYPYFSKVWVPDLSPANPSPIAFFARRGNIIQARAMADLAMWEGPENLGRKSNPVNHNVYMAEFTRLAQELQIKDQSMMQRSYTTYLSMTKMPYPDAYLGSSFAQVHPALGDDVGIMFGSDW